MFALPGDNIVVHIQSNGYSFFFHKRIGAIVPIWEESTDTVIHGTKITIEGLPSDILDEVFNKLSGILSIKKPDEIFAKCPVLYLRKLRLISISNEKKQYQIGLRCKHYAYQSGAWVETKEADTQFEAYLDMARWRVRVASSMEPSQSQTQFRMV